jgi:UDP-glucose 4-epimerase
METALVTGAAGFLGSHVADELLRMGMAVVALDDLSGGFKRNIPARCRFHRASITDSDAVTALFEQYCFDYVFHLAAYAAEGLSHFIRAFNYTNNLLGSVHLINAAAIHRVRCFVFTSSAAIYGAASSPLPEDARPAPEDPYGIAKLAVEQDLRAATRMFGLQSVIFRPHNVYGERQNLSDPYRNVIGIFMRQALTGQPCTIFGGGDQTRAFSYVGDVAPIIAASIKNPAAYGHVFNIGADDAYTIAELAELVQDALGRRVGIHHLPARAEALRVSCDHKKLRAFFPCEAPVELEAGLRRMAAWASSLEIGPLRPMERIEIPKNLPSSWRALKSAEKPAKRPSVRQRSSRGNS